MNFAINTAEISQAISKLKNGKACGPDLILNEMLKAGHSQLIPVLHKLFNYILRSGNFPANWRCNLLTPIHKKGEVSKPENYRGIAVGSNLCKLFCSVLQIRLSKFAKMHKLVPQCQIGFRPNARTADHVLSLKSIIDKYVNTVSKKNVFCCFVDFKSAFDTVSRKKLIYKLLQADIGGNFLNIIQNMYSDVKYAVKVCDGHSDSFSSSVGVKQGCVLSPLLFNLYLRDLPDIFDDTCDPVQLHDITVNCLMYADDLAILSESSRGLQNALNKLGIYCRKWDLTVNLDKTKVIVFNKSGHLLKKHHFSYMGSQIEIVPGYCYLGIIFTPSGAFKAACERLAEQGRKALFKLKILNTRNSIPMSFKLFQSLIVPILSYCSETWSPFYIKGINNHNFMQLGDNVPVEKVLINFCKYVLGVNRKTTHAAVRGELGQFSLLNTLLTNAAKFWFRLGAIDSETIVYQAYKESISQPDLGNWASFMKTLWSNFGLEEIWRNHVSASKIKSISALRQMMETRYQENWFAYLNRDLIQPFSVSKQGSKLRTYRTFKSKFKIENFLLSEKNFNRKRHFVKLRVSAHNLQIEVGRHTSPKTPAENRFCQLCNLQAVEDEMHFVLHCPFYQTERAALYSSFSNNFPNFTSLIGTEKFSFIMSCNSGDTEVCKPVLLYVSQCMMKRNDLNS